ncbi:hypothetical protein SSX86_029027 [Deinandra increscens subsp. villosa]|uniref:Uncharacterized protein n=1 Tax=Deinandra increscens subsp. villosa TaxID=3103831 RepID=A0AAP0CBU7_9ASTR
MLNKYDSELSPVNPKVPDVKNPATASPTVIIAGTITGLNITNSGVATASPITVPMRVMPAKPRRIPVTGSKAMMAIIFPVAGPPCWLRGWVNLSPACSWR